MVRLKIKYEDNIVRVVGVTAKEEQGWLLVRDESGNIVGRFDFDKVERWWIEVAATN